MKLPLTSVPEIFICVFTSLSFSMELDIGVTHSDFTLGIFPIKIYLFLLFSFSISCFQEYACMFVLFIWCFSTDEYWLASDTSSGYLEDAITGWGIWCKQHSLPSKEDQLLEGI